MREPEQVTGTSTQPRNGHTCVVFPGRRPAFPETSLDRPRGELCHRHRLVRSSVFCVNATGHVGEAVTGSFASRVPHAARPP